MLHSEMMGSHDVMKPFKNTEDEVVLEVDSLNSQDFHFMMIISTSKKRFLVPYNISAY